MNSKNTTENSLFINKFKFLSNASLFLRKTSSSSIKSNNLFIHKDSSKTNVTNRDFLLNSLNKLNINSTSIKSKKFTKYNSENKINGFNSYKPKTKIKTRIISYNSNSLSTKKNNILTEYNKKFISSKIKNFEFPENQNKAPVNINLSKSSDKSSSIFITGNNKNSNYNIKYKKICYEGTNNIIDNFGNYIDPLVIPEEDKIFDELKKINSLTERFKKKYKDNSLFKNIFGKKDEFKEKNYDINYNSKIIKEKKIKNNKIKRNKNNLYNFSKTFYNQNHFKITFEDKDLLDTLYMTSDEYFNKLNKIKKAKKKQKLNDYQNELLDLIKPVISLYGFERLKNKFGDIKILNEVKREWDFEYLKKIENNEEMIINDINFLYNKYLTNENNKSNYFSKYNPKNFELDLPNIEFKRVLKIVDDEQEKLKEYLQNKNKEIKILKTIKDSFNKNDDNNNKIKEALSKSLINNKLMKIFNTQLSHSKNLII